MICAAGLDWRVQMMPIPNVGMSANKKARRSHLIRMPRNTTELKVPLGVVSTRYRPLQNSEAFDFFDPIIGDEKAVFETAGSLGNGERVWVLAKVPGKIRVDGDDCCSKYLLLSNSHDGRSSVSVKFTPIRVVCQNTLNFALTTGDKAHRVRHSRNMQVRLQDVQQFTGVMWQTFKAAEQLFQTLAKVQVDISRLNVYLQAVYPLTDEQRTAKKHTVRWDRVIELFEIGDAPKLDPSHTLWGAYNAVARYEDYRRANESGPDRRLNRVWFGQGAELKLHALQVASELMQKWIN
jgi:phage/plasmid-like protein (TIGR03299 family)